MTKVGLNASKIGYFGWYFRRCFVYFFPPPDGAARTFYRMSKLTIMRALSINLDSIFCRSTSGQMEKWKLSTVLLAAWNACRHINCWEFRLTHETSTMRELLGMLLLMFNLAAVKVALGLSENALIVCSWHLTRGVVHFAATFGNDVLHVSLW